MDKHFDCGVIGNSRDMRQRFTDSKTGEFIGWHWVGKKGLPEYSFYLIRHEILTPAQSEYLSRPRRRREDNLSMRRRMRDGRVLTHH